MECSPRWRYRRRKPFIILALGDSKTAPDSQTWAYILAQSIKTTANTQWRAIELGRGGYRVDNTLNNLTTNNDGQFSSAIIPSALTNCQTSTNSLDHCREALNGAQPEYILINLGVNDVGFTPPWSLPNQTTWQNNYIAILDALNAQWPDSLIYITKPWKAQSGGDDAVWDTMAGWIDNVVAARPAFTFVGDDERAWFEPNTATYSDDDIHYNAEGQAAAADAKQTALGY
ncbi:MAG TPA: SGNH/GDSL hydrolase family protein [Candidatus Paceibacterota bacterium]